MAYRRYRFSPLWREFDQMMDEMENRFADMLQETRSERLLPEPGSSSRIMPALRQEFSVDVREHDNEIVVVADLPGADKQDIDIQLVDPRTLEISFRREEELEEQRESYYVHERRLGTLCRRIRLPGEVREEGARSTFVNGVLEVRLPRMQISEERRIPIE